MHRFLYVYMYMGISKSGRIFSLVFEAPGGMERTCEGGRRMSVHGGNKLEG